MLETIDASLRSPIMKAISALTAFALAIPSGGLSATESSLVQGGRYEVAVALELPHLVDAAARKTATICIDPDNTAPYGLKALSDNNPLAKCSPKSSRLVDLRSAIYPRLASVANRSRTSAAIDMSNAIR